MLASISRRCMMGPTCSHSAHSLMPSSRTSISQTWRSSLCQPRCPCHSMHSRTLLPSIWTSIIAPLLEIWINSPKFQEATSCTLPIRLPSILPTQGSLMGKPFSIWFNTWRRPETLAFVSSLNWTRVLSITATWTSQAIGTSCLPTSTPAPPSLVADGLCSCSTQPWRT